ncbi:hypothetical protein LCGC14_2329040 [marine sediment metagenome]|uniref:Uncharacterized protein n=1 Tax=marine sediment metagenome TaxID=412755 RepID=A0A0F9FAF3_9ZZZZ
MEKTIKVFEDAGYGWGKVLISELKSLGVEKQISSCSYMNGNYAYLEEDRDFGTYIRKLRDSNPNITLKFNYINHEDQ